MLVRVGGKDTESVVGALSGRIRRLPETMMETLTWDRGMEMADHKRFSVATEVKVYFCDPRSPWQRATNENTNRLLRQYLPKHSDLSVYSQEDLDAIPLRLNTRPRKTLATAPRLIHWHRPLRSPVESTSSLQTPLIVTRGGTGSGRTLGERLRSQESVSDRHDIRKPGEQLQQGRLGVPAEERGKKLAYERPLAKHG